MAETEEPAPKTPMAHATNNLSNQTEPCPASEMPLLTLHCIFSCPKSLRRSFFSTAHETLNSPNPWTVFLWIKDIKPFAKLFWSHHLVVWQWDGTWRPLLKRLGPAPVAPSGLLPLQLFSGISSSNILGRDVTQRNTPHPWLTTLLVRFIFLSALCGPLLWESYFARGVCSLLQWEGSNKPRHWSDSRNLWVAVTLLDLHTSIDLGSVDTICRSPRKATEGAGSPRELLGRGEAERV